MSNAKLTKLPHERVYGFIEQILAVNWGNSGTAERKQCYKPYYTNKYKVSNSKFLIRPGIHRVHYGLTL